MKNYLKNIEQHADYSKNAMEQKPSKREGLKILKSKSNNLMSVKGADEKQN
ncbi:MAG: hypothetical protein LBI60_04280 [Bacteroidales bacterium]|jgi:hypothetical protein|nr:hypothetical protein [Bacteroidales bacterium]